MGKVFHCKDLGMECDFVVRGETEEEILQKGAEHAKAVHNIEEMPPEMVEKVRAAIQDE